MKFYSKSDISEVRIGPVPPNMIDLIPDAFFFSACVVGRAKGSIATLEILIVTPNEVHIYGPSFWSRPLLGLKVTTKSLDYIRLTSEDGEERLFSCGAARRKRLIQVINATSAVVGRTDLHELVVVDLTPVESEVPKRQSELVSRVKGQINERIQTEVSRVKDVVDKSGAEILKIREEVALEEHPEFSTVEEMREAFTPNSITHGEEVFSSRVCGTHIHIYDKGFVQLGKPGLVPIEKLRLITSSASVNRKTGIGRGAAAVLTSGISLTTSSNRGYLTLVVLTDRDSHDFSSTNPENSEIAEAETAAAVGKAVLDSLERTTSEVTPVMSVADEIAKLVLLRDTGAVTDEEFQAAKQRLIG